MHSAIAVISLNHEALMNYEYHIFFNDIQMNKAEWISFGYQSLPQGGKSPSDKRSDQEVWVCKSRNSKSRY